MTNVVHHKFGKNTQEVLFSADIYSHDMKKYQFEISTRSIFHAYNLFIDAAKRLGVHFVRCIAVYEGNVHKRLERPKPIKVWLQDRSFNGLEEF